MIYITPGMKLLAWCFIAKYMREYISVADAAPEGVRSVENAEATLRRIP